MPEVNIFFFLLFSTEACDFRCSHRLNQWHECGAGLPVFSTGEIPFGLEMTKYFKTNTPAYNKSMQNDVNPCMGVIEMCVVLTADEGRDLCWR